MRFIFLFYLLTSLSGYTQNMSKPQEKGAIFKLYDGTIAVGKLLSFNESTYKLKIITGDTLTIDPFITTKIYLPEEINLYGKGRYSYKKGLKGSFAIGVSPEHSNFDFSGSYILNSKFSFGGGFGFHNNSFSIQTVSSAHWGNIFSRTYFVNGQFFFTNRAQRIYATGKLGYSDHRETRQLPILSDGIVLEGGVGLEFSSKNKVKYFIELSQYTSNAKGALVSNDVNALSDIEFDIWFHRIVFTMGIQIGK